MYGLDARGSDRGIIPQAAEAVFAEAAARGGAANTSIAVSLLEIYCDRIRDLSSAARDNKGTRRGHSRERGARRHPDGHARSQ